MTAPVTIDSAELSDRLASPVPPRVLDVRTPGEFETAHIAGSVELSGVLASLALPELKWVAAAVGGGLTAASPTNTCAMGMAPCLP